jgi:Flp pilus assembly protein TadB
MKMDKKLGKIIINCGGCLLIVILINCIFQELSGIQQFFIALIAALLVNSITDFIIKKSKKI